MCLDKKARIISKRGSGVPTVPATTDHTDGTWIATDIYEGELYVDTDTGNVFTRNGSSIVRINPSFDIRGTEKRLQTTVINIGAWDMDADTNRDVDIGVDCADVRMVQVLIVNDADTVTLDLTTSGAYVLNNGTTSISLSRDVAGDFDNTGYDDKRINRGYVTITYIV